MHESEALLFSKTVVSIEMTPSLNCAMNEFVVIKLIDELLISIIDSDVYMSDSLIAILES
jgi:hypothetical protein